MSIRFQHFVRIDSRDRRRFSPSKFSKLGLWSVFSGICAFSVSKTSDFVGNAAVRRLWCCGKFLSCFDKAPDEKHLLEKHFPNIHRFVEFIISLWRCRNLERIIRAVAI